jgi:hypothetical protein
MALPPLPRFATQALTATTDGVAAPDCAADRGLPVANQLCSGWKLQRRAGIAIRPILAPTSMIEPPRWA